MYLFRLSKKSLILEGSCRISESNTSKYLKPFAIYKQNFIEQSDINKLNKINIPKQKDMPWISRMNTSTYKYQDMTKTDKELVDKLKNIDSLEHFARENYNLKKENEEIFIIEYEENE